MADKVINSNEAEREKLLPVVGVIFGIYLILIVLGYAVGSMF